MATAAPELLYFPSSPFARMARVLAREWRLDVTETEVPFPPPDGLFAATPLGQVPVLLADGVATFPTFEVLMRLWAMAGRPAGAYRPESERELLLTVLAAGDAVVAARYQRWAGLRNEAPNHIGYDPAERNLATPARRPDAAGHRRRLHPDLVGSPRRSGVAGACDAGAARRRPRRAGELPGDPAVDLAARRGGGKVKFTVAIDGPAASGKGTIGRAVAERFGFAHLDTGLLYRAVGVQALQDGRGVLDPHWAAELARRLAPEDLTRGDLRSARAGQAASKVAALPEVRAALLDFQRRFARRDGGAVLDGRDIGTVICPAAEAKLFVVASDEARAARRQAELGTEGFEQVLADLRARDARDATREVAPMVAAKDALLLDTTDFSIDAAVAEAVAYVDSRIRAGGA